MGSFGTLSFSTSLSKVTQNDDATRSNQIIGDFKKRKRKSRINNNDSNNNDSSNVEIMNEEDTDYNDLDLVYCDIKGKFQMKTLKQILKECKIGCYTIQFFIKRHFVESFKSLPSIYVVQ